MDRKYYIHEVNGIPSPALVVYLELVQRNIERAIEMVGGNTGKLRCHAKTHKTKEVSQLMRTAGITKYKCATLREAEMLAEVGINDILIAYQLVGPNIDRFIRLARHFPEVDFKAVVDHPDAVNSLASAAKSNRLTIKTMLDLNVGMNRTGIAPGDQAVALYTQIEQAEALTPWGLHVYDGHIHDENLADRRRACEKSLSQVADMKRQLAAKGLDVPLVVMGGTPTFAIYAKTPDVEASPGTFIFFDHGYATHYPDLGFTPAALLLSRVISKPTPEYITLDLGHKAIAADPQGARGKVLSIEGAEVDFQHEEHWVVRVPAGTSVKLGQVVYVCPTHICPTVALHQAYYVIGADGNCVGRWTVAARNRDLNG